MIMGDKHFCKNQAISNSDVFLKNKTRTDLCPRKDTQLHQLARTHNLAQQSISTTLDLSDLS